MGFTYEHATFRCFPFSSQLMLPHLCIGRQACEALRRLHGHFQVLPEEVQQTWQHVVEPVMRRLLASQVLCRIREQAAG